MVASLRAELLILRKWPAVWALLLVAPALTLLESYVVPFLQYRSVTPSEYNAVGTPDQILPMILPGQWVITAVGHFDFSGNAPFIILGAVLAGGDWGRGTIATSLVQRSGRVHAFAGHVIAVWAAVIASVVLTFAVAAACAAIVSADVGVAATSIAAPWPGITIVARALGVAVLVAGTFAAIGVSLGVIFRNIAAALVWTVFVEGMFDTIALQAGGFLRTVDDLLPNASGDSLVSAFGASGGGAGVSMFFRVRPAVAPWILLAYIVAGRAVSATLLVRRDVAPAARRPIRRIRRTVATAASSGQGALLPDPVLAGRRQGLLATFRAEVLVLRRRPVAWVFALITPVYTLLNNYLIQYVFLKTADSGVFSGLQPDQILPTLLPARFVATAVDNFGSNFTFVGTIPFILLGALVAGTDWGTGTIKTTLLQGPSRTRSLTGQALAVLTMVAASAVLTFVLAAAASTAVAAAETGSISPTAGPFPAMAVIARGLAVAMLVSVTYTTIGLTLGAIFRSAGGAIAAALLWTILLAPTLTNLATVPGPARTLDQALPDGNVPSLTSTFGPVSFQGQLLPSQVIDSVTIAAVVLVAYGVASFLLSVLIIRRRDII